MQRKGVKLLERSSYLQKKKPNYLVDYLKQLVWTVLAALNNLQYSWLIYALPNCFQSIYTTRLYSITSLEIPIGRILRKTDANCLFFCLFCGVIVGCRNHDMDIINTNARAGQKNRTRCHEVTDHLLRTNIDRRVN